jgi:hypothetical protein
VTHPRDARLDLLLLTDSIQEREEDCLRDSRGRLIDIAARLHITEEDKLEVERRSGVQDYFLPLAAPETGLADLRAATPQLYGCRIPHAPLLGVVDLATAAASAGFSVRIVDNVLRFPSRTRQAETLLALRPRVVGVSTTFLRSPAGLRRLLRWLEPRLGDAWLVGGGPTLAMHPELHELFDVVVTGEGETSLLALLSARRAGEELDHLPGMSSPGPNRRGRVLTRESSRFIPPADWRLAHRSNELTYCLELSRGCDHACLYCTYERGKSIRPLADIRRELLANAALEIRRYRVIDANFTDGPRDRRRHPLEVCQLIRELGLALEWSCYARVDDMSDELAEGMRAAGCEAVFFGVESGDDAMLRRMHKGFDAAAALRGIETARRHGLRVHANFLVGFPGETEASFATTLAFIESARPDTVVLGPLRVESRSLMAKRFVIEGDGLTWRHASMDSQMALALVRGARSSLARSGVHVGTEFRHAAYRGLGLSSDEATQLIADTELLAAGGEPAASPAYTQAVSRTRVALLDRFPAAVARDQRAWDGVLELAPISRQRE